MTKCSQCDKNAMYEVGGHSLCQECFLKWQQVQQTAQNQKAATLNYLSDEISYSMGLSDKPPRLKIPQPIHQTIPIGTLNHIKVDNSNVGAINTGDFVTIDTNLELLFSKGQEPLAKAIAEFTSELAKSTAIQSDLKKELFEQLSFITSQLKDQTPKKSLVNPIWESVLQKVSTVSNLVNIGITISKLIDKLS